MVKKKKDSWRDILNKAKESVSLPDIPSQSGKAKSVNKSELYAVTILTNLSVNAEDEQTREIAFKMLQRFIKVSKKKK